MDDRISHPKHVFVRLRIPIFNRLITSAVRKATSLMVYLHVRYLVISFLVNIVRTTLLQLVSHPRLARVDMCISNLDRKSQGSQSRVFLHVLLRSVTPTLIIGMAISFQKRVGCT